MKLCILTGNAFSILFPEEKLRGKQISNQPF